MDISTVDKNLRIETSLPETDLTWYSAQEAPFCINGSHLPKGETPYWRLPQEVAKATSAGVEALYKNTAGVRVRFATDSPYIAIKAEWSQFCCFSHMTLCGTSGFDLYRCENGKQSYVNVFLPGHTSTNGFEALRYTFNEGITDYVLNFPLYNNVDKLYIGVKSGSVVKATKEQYHNEKPVVFYGSSITQGGCASRPGSCYQGRLSRMLNMDYRNLGFSGSALGEKAIVEYIAGLDMSAFVCDYDHNAPNAEYLEKTHYAMYQTIRKYHPQLPYIMISHPPSGKELGEQAKRRKIIMDSYQRAVQDGDNNVYFIDGDTFFPGDALDCTVDSIHPTDLGFYFMAQNIKNVLYKVLYQ